MKFSSEPSASPPALPSLPISSMPSDQSTSPPGKKKAIKRHVPLIAGHAAYGQTYKPHFKFTRFSTVTSNVDITRNVTNRFLSRTGQEILKFRMEDGRNIKSSQLPIVVIHPGSRNLRVGLHTDAVPKTIPSVLARKTKGPKPKDLNPMNIFMHSSMKISTPVAHPQQKENEVSEAGENNYEDKNPAGTEVPDIIEDSREAMENAFKRTMKQASLRIPPNAISLVQNFNGSAEGIEISPMNDPHSIEWIRPTTENSPALFVGQQALDVVVSEATDEFHYQLIWPFLMRTWQFSSSASIMAWRQDVAALFYYSIEQCGFKPSQTHVAIVLPDLFHSNYIEALLNVLFEDLEVNQVLIGHESIMSCYGAGLSTACVVDMGATCCTAALVEQGELIAASLGMYGGDQVTLEFVRRLKCNNFPFEFDLKMPWDWQLAESLKEKWCTANESELGTQVYDFYRRAPNHPTQKYQVKVYNEVYLAPLVYLYHCSKAVCPEKMQQMEYALSSIVNANLPTLLSAFPTTTLSTLVPALDTLVAQLLVEQTSRSEDRLKKFTSSILMVGGGSRVALKFLETKLKSQFSSVFVTPPPRDMNPGHVAWKGLSVATRLESFAENWVRIGEWRAYGAQGCWNTKAVLTFLEQQPILSSNSAVPVPPVPRNQEAMAG